MPAATTREVAEAVRATVAGGGVSFARLFAPAGVMRYPFAAPGMPTELHGRAAIDAFFSGVPRSGRSSLDMDGVDMVVRETDDPEVVVVEIEHHGRKVSTGEPYRFRALGVIRVRDGEIITYDDYMDPIAMARLLDRTPELAAALGSPGGGSS